MLHMLMYQLLKNINYVMPTFNIFFSITLSIIVCVPVNKVVTNTINKLFTLKP